MEPQLSRRAAMSGLGLALGAGLAAPGLEEAQAQSPQPTRDPLAAIPVTGRSGPGLEGFDQAVRAIIDRHGLAGAALAIARNGRLVFAKGYGWANIASSERVQPNMLFGMASLSKPITAAATLKLVEQGRLRLDDPVFDLLRIEPMGGGRLSPRLRLITVRQCLNHSGGWDRNVSGDPISWEPQICRALRVRPPLTPSQFLSFASTLPLDFEPGTQQKYSNIGYILLGEVIAAVSQRPYQQYVQEEILRPMGITRASLHRTDGRYLAGEVVRHLTGSLIGLPPMLLPMVDAAGGWSASVVDMVRFMTNLDGSRGQPVLNEPTRRLMVEPPRPPLRVNANGTFVGLGWDTVRVEDNTVTAFKDGSYQGMRTYMKHLPNGVCWCLAFNASMDFDPIDTQLAGNAVQEVRRHIEEINEHPDIDLFEEFP